MGETFQFIKYNLRRLWCSPRPFIILFAVYAGMDLCFGSVRTYLAETGQTVQATEFFTFATTNRIPQWILVFGMLLLLGDAPFFHEGMEFYILRSNRIRWLTGQVLFCVFMILGYVILVAGMFVFMFRGYLSFVNEWSNAITLSCQIQNGAFLNIKMIISFPMNVITSGSPYAIFGLSYFYTVLLLILLCLLCMICNVKLRMGFGCFGVTILLIWRIVLDTVGGTKFFHYLSPCNLATVSDRTINLFNVCYTISFFICACCLLCLWIYGVTQKADLQRSPIL